MSRVDKKYPAKNEIYCNGKLKLFKDLYALLFEQNKGLPVLWLKCSFQDPLEKLRCGMNTIHLSYQKVRHHFQQDLQVQDA